MVRYPSAAPGTWALDFLLPTTSFGSQASFWRFQTSLQQSGRVCWRCLLLPGKPGHWHAETFTGAPAAGGVTMGGSPNPKNPMVQGAASLEAASGSPCPAVAAAPRGQCCLAPRCCAAAPKQSKRSESAFSPASGHHARKPKDALKTCIFLLWLLLYKVPQCLGECWMPLHGGLAPTAGGTVHPHIKRILLSSKDQKQPWFPKDIHPVAVSVLG